MLRESVAVGVQADGRQTDESIAGLNVVPGHQALAVNDTDDSTGKVILAVGIQSRHLGGFAADQGAFYGAAGSAEPGDNLHGDFGVKLAGGVVVEKKQRLRTLCQDVVDAVVDQVARDGSVPSGAERQLELGADAVDTAHQDWLAHAARRRAQRKHAAEVARAAGKHSRPAGGGNMSLHPCHGGVGGVNVDPSRRVAAALLRQPRSLRLLNTHMPIIA